jgi:hypothetical protein
VRAPDTRQVVRKALDGNGERIRGVLINAYCNDLKRYFK